MKQPPAKEFTERARQYLKEIGLDPDKRLIEKTDGKSWMTLEDIAAGFAMREVKRNNKV